MPTIYVLSKNKKKYHKFSSEKYHFHSFEISQYIHMKLHRRVFEMESSIYQTTDDKRKALRSSFVVVSTVVVIHTNNVIVFIGPRDYNLTM